MHVDELNLEELKHEHPLTPVDLQLMLRDYEEDDEDYDEKELIRTQNFKCKCNRCDKRIDWYHRYYYKCSMSSCNYSLHKFCEDMPTTLKFQGHPSHTLILKKTTNDEECHGCFKHCEEGLDPGKWFYHCVRCAQSIHSACAPLILQSEQGVNSLHVEGVYKFINISFGFRSQVRHHPHLLSLAPGTENDGLCPICRSSMQSNMIWKCLDCSFAMHNTCTAREHGVTITPIDKFGGTKRIIQHQPKRNTEFYPTHIMKRPVTRHYEVIDQDI